MHKILIIDDDVSVRDVLENFFKSENFNVEVATDGKSGLERLSAQKYDLYLTDLVMPNMGGMDILNQAKSTINSATPCILITAFGTVKTAVEAMKLGAFDYVTKPFSLEEILLVANRAIEVAQLRDENVKLKKELKKKYDFHGIIGTSQEMQKVYSMIEKIAGTDSTILITGDSGTGKELIARIIHYNSARSQGNFVPINCAAIPKDLLESELFGHERGAFTGAVNTHIGRFEYANGGTLFLDEIGELDPMIQVKLLRVLQERSFERVGSTKTIKVDVRIVTATNKNLEDEVREGRFREDLYYRLNVIPLHLPPLRERKDDIPLLIEHFLKKFSQEKGKDPPRLTKETMDTLLTYEWKGNVRELENLIERLVILKPGETVKPEDLPDRLLGEGSESTPPRYYSGEDIVLTEEGIDLNDFLDRYEEKLILQALKLSGGVKSKAATLLGLNRTTLVEKLKKKGIAQKTN